ncbi:MAG: hypothetical protein CMH27_04025 [Micavibrio sp.]|nr:hypothetical protein [Micavibrio sp.]|tara:strand:+ start:744 stop:1544 length:801 start_codon:yes stop_codon:yes gene_type:complete
MAHKNSMKQDKTQFVCKLTKKQGKAVKSHIIPSSFFMRQGDAPPLIMATGENVFPKKSRTGLYDQALVIEEGEKYFDAPDDYAHKLLISGREQLHPLIVEGKEVGLGLNSYDYEKLKLFFLSVLWRAAETSLGPFSRVKIGPHASKIRQMILDNDPGCPETYSVVLFRFAKVKSMKKGTVLFPYREKLLGCNWYRFFFCEYTALIKVDQRKTPDPYNLMQLNPKEPLQIFDRDLANTPEAKMINTILKANDDKLPPWFQEASKNKK